jgi:hypothetical protein
MENQCSCFTFLQSADTFDHRLLSSKNLLLSIFNLPEYIIQNACCSTATPHYRATNFGERKSTDANPGISFKKLAHT